MGTTNTQPPSIAIVAAVARREGESPADLRPPLWNAIDPEALDLLFEKGDSTVSVSFEYRGYRVDVDGNGSVRVENEPEPAAE